MTTMKQLVVAVVAALTMAACGGAAAPAVTALEVTPSTLSVSVGASAQVAVYAIYDDGSRIDVTAQVAWDQNAECIAGGAAGLIEGYQAGAADLTVRWSGHAATAHVDVDPSLTALFGLAPSPSTPGALAMMGLFSDGSIHPVDVAISWVSSREDLLAVSGAGALSALSPGVVWIRATVDGLDFWIKIRVNDDLSITIGA